MRNQVNRQKNQSVLNYLWFPLLALFLVLAVIGSLNVISLKKDNTELKNAQINLEEKLTDLQDELSANKDKIALLEGSANEAQQKIDKYAKEVEKYKKLASAPKIVLGEQTALSEVKPVEPAKEIKTEPKVETPAAQTATKPAPIKKTYYATVKIEGIGTYKTKITKGESALAILKRTGSQNGFSVKTTHYSFGDYISSIGTTKLGANQYWAFYYNGKYSDTGASGQKVTANDTISFKIASW